MNTLRTPPKALEVFNYQRLTAIRKRAKLSPAEFADRLACTPQYVGQLENGKAEPSLAFLTRLSAQFGVRISSLFREPRADDDE